MIRESWEEKGGCPATDSGALPPESEDRSHCSRLKGVGKQSHNSC